ncbi:MAG: Maf family protein [Pseudomonadota bacterium]
MLILASRSPRRRQLLSLLVDKFEVESADVDETRLPDETAAEMTLRLALRKAEKVHSHYPDSFVLGGDTTVSIDEEILGKPNDRKQAVDMLLRLSGRTHEVYSAVAIRGEFGSKEVLSTTAVTFRSLTAEDINTYCDSDEPYDKAGGYGIQGPAGQFVTRIDGSFSGVMGLPLWHTQQLLSLIE